MAFVDFERALGLRRGIEAENDLGHFHPGGSIHLGIKEAEISRQMSTIVIRDPIFGRGALADQLVL